MHHHENGKTIPRDSPIHRHPIEELPKDKQHEQEVPVDPKEETGNEAFPDLPPHQQQREKSQDIDRRDNKTDKDDLS